MIEDLQQADKGTEQKSATIEQAGVESFDKIYEIMEYSFPEGELRSREGQRKLFSDGAYRMAVMRRGGEIGAFIAYWQLEHAVFLEHFAVRKELRGAGLGGNFLDQLLSGFEGMIVLEVEPPLSDIAARRIKFYERHGLVLNGYPYTQPPLKHGGKPQELMIMSRGRALDEAQFERLSRQIHAVAYKDCLKYMSE